MVLDGQEAEVEDAAAAEEEGEEEGVGVEVGAEEEESLGSMQLRIENGGMGGGGGGSRRATRDRTRGSSWREREAVGDREESPRKRRRRSASLDEPPGAGTGGAARRVLRGGRGNSDSGDIGEDGHDPEYSSALSSTPSSRQTSPARRRNPRNPKSHSRQFPSNPSHTHTQSLDLESDSRRHPWASAHFYERSNAAANSNNGSNSKKRKTTVNGTTSDDDYRDDDDEPSLGDEHQLNSKPEPRKRPRPRRSRNPTLRFESSSPQTRKQASRSSPMPPNSRLSPTRITKHKGTSATATTTTTTTTAAGRPQRKITLPVLRTTIVDLSDNSSSSSDGEPVGRRRLTSAARTPGSPISMSHKPKRDTAGRTVLHRACGRGAVAEVETILEQSTELINAEDNAGYMPIHEASLNGHLSVVKVLVKYGALYDVRSRIDRESPLLDAVENGHVPVVKYLIDLGANPTLRDNRGRTCLDANSEGDESPEVREEIEALLKAAAKQRPAPRASDDENNSVRGEGRDSPSSRDDSVVSPAHHSPAAPAQNARRRNARAEQSRKDLLWLDSGKSSVIKLRERAREGDIQMVHALLETGLKPDNETLVGAIKGGHSELVSMLLAYQAEVDPVPGVMDKEGSRRKREVSMPVPEETPMLAAIGRGNNTILRYLLENGADPLRKDSKGRTYPEIAREREGEYWKEEVAMLQEAWQKAGGRSEARSPSRHKPSPKTRHSTTMNTNTAKRRNSSSTQTQSGRPTRSSTNDEKRSASANSSHRPGDLPTVSESESVAVGGASSKKRRRLVSGKVRDEEAARAADPPTTMKGRDEDRESCKKNAEKLAIVKPGKTDTEDIIPRKPMKQQPSEDVTMVDAPPLARSAKARPARERRPSSTRSNSIAREMKRPASRTRSPPRAPRSDIERRQQEEQLRRRRREEHPDDRDRDRKRGSIAEEPRRPKREDSSKPPTPAAPEPPPRRREASTSSNTDKTRQADGDRRQRVKDREKEKERERKEGRLRERGLISPEQLQSEAREVLRKKHLTKEMASIQRKALKESVEKRADDVITRELELRRQREEEERRQRIIREREEREQEEANERAENERLQKELREKAERELEVKRQEERLAQARAEAERILKESTEREARDRREREEQERKAKEREEREAREKAQREAKEREERERQARLAEQARLEEEERQREALRVELERQRKEAERQRREQERREQERREQERLEQERREQERLEQERKAAEEEAKRRDLEREKAMKEARDRKVAEELQLQIAREQEALRLQEQAQAEEEARIQSLPYTLRVAAENHARARSPEDPQDFVPFFVATLPSLTGISNGSIHKQEQWVLNLQAALVLGTADLELTGYMLTERRAATEHERLRMWSALSLILCEVVIWSKEKTMEERARSRAAEMEKYLKMQSVFWVKVRSRLILFLYISTNILMLNWD